MLLMMLLWQLLLLLWLLLLLLFLLGLGFLVCFILQYAIFTFFSQIKLKNC